jgi:hypothetical protein
VKVTGLEATGGRNARGNDAVAGRLAASARSPSGIASA